MLPAPDEAPQTAKTPDYVPARMLNEFVYCPRLFFYEWVEGLFRESADTVEGKFQHRRVDSGAGALPEAGEIEEEELRMRSVTLSSDGYGVIAKMDLLEVSAGAVTPVDYKRGKPAEGDKGLEAWPSDRMQLAVQALVLRDNGYRCEEGLVYYGKTRQRVRVRLDEELMGETRRTIEQARGVAAGGKISPALVDSPKCPRCSLAGICLPDETTVLPAAAPEPDTQLSLFAEEDRAPRAKPPAGVRRLVTPRDELRPLYLNTQGLRVGETGAVLRIKEKQTVVQDVRIGEICQLNLMGNMQLSTQAVQSLCEAGVPVCYFSQGGWLYGITTGMNTEIVCPPRVQPR